MLQKLLSLLTISLMSLTACTAVPEYQSGPEAQALADKMLQAINYDAWEDTAAVSWTFRGEHHHFWDRNRNLVQVEWDNNRVQFNKNTLAGMAYTDEVPVRNRDERFELIKTANEFFINDAFWLNPLFHINSPGAELGLVDNGVLAVHYSSGGVTPGDTYVFVTDPDGLVTEMRLWVSIVPIKGASAEFNNYITTETGVKCATEYNYLVTIDITNLKMYAKYDSGADDIFSDFTPDVMVH